MATQAAENPSPGKDERLLRENRLRKLLRRPELGALGGAVLVWVFFAIVAGSSGFLTLRGTANYLQVSAEQGILAVSVSLLMIGGEFDLSIGSMIGGAGMIIAILTAQFGWNIWAAIGVSLVVALAIGALNGLLVVRTKLPSFIITLATLFIIRGATIGMTRLITGRTQVGGLKDVQGFASAFQVFAGSISVNDPSSTRGIAAAFPISIVWWLLIAAVATYVLLRTRPGNWIFGMGGDQNAARNVGVPVNLMKIALFMATAAAAWLVATIQVLEVGSADTLRGEQREFYTIIAVVIGGTLLTGGYGSAIGAVLGALIYGMVQQGLIFAHVDSDWLLVFLGAMLIVAVLVNNFIRKQASGGKS
jgi:simple sugar transport system permease protein